MKNIKDRINSQLFKNQEVELSAERVELGKIDDLKKQLDLLTGNLDKQIDKVRGMAIQFVDLEDKFKNLSDESSKTMKIVRDLGLEEGQLGFVFKKSQELAKLCSQFVKDLR